MKIYSKAATGLMLAMNLASYANSEEVTLNFAATSDIHGRIYPYEYGIDAVDADAGQAKVSTIVKELRKEDSNLVLIDVGDTVQDNSAELFNNLDVHPTVEAMNMMGYNFWVLGNHEFNFEKTFIERNIKAFNGTVVTANIENEKDGSKFVEAYQIMEIDGVRVAIVGLTTPHMPMWEASAPENIKGLSFIKPEVEVKEILKEIEGKYDVLVGAFHLGREDEYGGAGTFDIAEANPEFDLIFSGHEHAKFVTEVNGVTVIEPGAYGWAVAKGEITVKKENGKWNVVEVEAENIETKNVEADKEILEKFKFVHDKSVEEANKVVGKITDKFIEGVDYITGDTKITTMPTSQVQDNAIIEFINKVQKHYSKADISSSAIFNFDSNLNAGDFKKKDVAFIYKYTNTLMGVEMTGENLLKYMEWSAKYYNQAKAGDITISFNPEVRGYNYDMFDGVNYKIDISKPVGERIVDVTIDGKPLDLNKEYKVAINNYRFGTLLNLGLVTNEDVYYDSYKELQDNGRIREMIVKYIEEVAKGTVSPTVDNNWEIIGYDTDVKGKDEIIEKIKKGEIKIPASEDGRTPNVKSININDYK